MPRLARKDLDSPFLHVMIQGVNKEYIFDKTEYIEKYLNIIEKYKNEYHFTILAYCIMNNHAHFLIHTENIEEIGKFMHKTNLIYSQMYNKEKNRCGVLFRNKYKAEPIYNIKYLINCIKYIHNNPVKAGIVSDCKDYKYSSYNDYINKGKITKSKIICEIFGTKTDYFRLFDEAYSKRFIDNEENENDIQEYILEGIRQYIKENDNSIIDILSNRNVLKELIRYLKEECNIKYTEIRGFFNMTKGTMDALRI